MKENGFKVKYFFNSDGTFEGKIWKNEKGYFHREDGPTVEYSNGTRIWYKNGKLHREDGPTVIWGNGVHEYYLNGKEYTKKEYWKDIEKINDFKS